MCGRACSTIWHDNTSFGYPGKNMIPGRSVHVVETSCGFSMLECAEQWTIVLCGRVTAVCSIW